MKPYGAKKNTRDKWKPKWFSKPHGSKCRVCNPPDKVSASKKRARREGKEEVTRREYEDQFRKKLIEEAKALLNDVKFRDLTYSLKTGDRVSLNEEIPWYDPPIAAGTIGIATIDWELDEEDPIGGHGGITVVFEDGRVEHFTVWKWWESLTKL